MNAVATHTAKPYSTDSSEIAKMVLIGVITVVLMALAILGSSPSRADTAHNTIGTSHQLVHDHARLRAS